MKQYFAINHHLNVTNGNQSLAHHLINYTMNKLQAKAGDPDIDAIINFFTPFMKAWNLGFVAWRNAFNYEMGTTVAQNAIIDTLTHTKAPDWVLKVLTAYPEGTDMAKALIPHKRQAFITGTILDRMTGIETFITGIGLDAALAPVKADAQAFFQQIITTNQNHQAAKEALTDCSKTQEVLRQKTCSAMLSVEGSLMTKYYATPNMVDMFFDVSAMRRNQSAAQDEGYLVSLAPSEIKLLDLRFIGKETYEITNNGDYDACVFFSASNTVTTIPAIKFDIKSAESIQIDLSTLPADQRFAYAANLSNEQDGELNIVQIT